MVKIATYTGSRGEEEEEEEKRKGERKRRGRGEERRGRGRGEEKRGEERRGGSIPRIVAREYCNKNNVVPLGRKL